MSDRLSMDAFEHAERLTAVFGRLPSFHDAEILRVVLDRTGEDGPSLNAQIHCFQMTPEVDSRGTFLPRNHNIVTLRFCNIRLDHLRDFHGQNVISDLEITSIDPTSVEGRRYRVAFNASYGCSFELDCLRMVVVSVESCSSHP